MRELLHKMGGNNELHKVYEIVKGERLGAKGEGIGLGLSS